MNFPNDDSTQTGIINVSYTTPYSSITNPNILFNDFKSGIYNPSLNTIRLFTNNTDALTIDSNQCLYGNGTGLTNIGYSNVIDRPTNFQSDWNSTIINRPDLTVYATTLNLNSLSTNSTLSINNLNATSTTIFDNLNALSTKFNIKR